MNTIKDYYLEVQQMYNDAVNILTALNTAMMSNVSSVQLNVGGTSYNIPSYLYMESKLDELNQSVANLINIPESGQAWLTTTGNSSEVYRLNMLSANAAPGALSISSRASDFSVHIQDNNIFKDMVFPKLSIRCMLNGITPDIDEIAYAKITFKNSALYAEALSRFQTTGSYNSYATILSWLSSEGNEGQYETYESKIDLPLRSRDTDILFEISEILGYGIIDHNNSDDDVVDEFYGKKYVDIRLTSSQYSSDQDTARIFTLQPGMYVKTTQGYGRLLLFNLPGSYNINEFRAIIVQGDMEVTSITTDQTWSEQFDQYLTQDEQTWVPYRFVDIPLEEDPYICICIAAVRNGIRSRYTEAMFFDLNTINVKDKNGNTMIDLNGNPISYMTYYTQYAKNAGDTLMSLIDSVLPGVSEFSRQDFATLQYSNNLKPVIDRTQISTTIINNHLSDDTAIDKLKTLHAQKSEFQSQLDTIKNQIENIINTISITDFSQEQNVSRTALNLQLNTLYAERSAIEHQIIAVVNEINTLANSNVLPVDSLKYRLRGHIDMELLEQTVQTMYYAKRVELIGLDVQYKYKSVSKTHTVTTSINNSLFTDWIKFPTPLKERAIRYASGKMIIQTITPANTDNSIKWNQIDIPIQQGEDVIIRVRGIYNIGQPFMNVYTPWSDEQTFTFPEQYTLNADVQQILQVNKQDSVNALFTKQLLEDGYEEHINNKVVDNNAIYYHMPENIASGFYTSEQKIIPLRDKLYDINKNIENISQELLNIQNSNYEITLYSSDKEVKLIPNAVNTIQVKSYQEHAEAQVINTFVEEDLNIVIHNTGINSIKFYSIFPGDHTQPLAFVNQDTRNVSVSDYNIFPLYAGGGFTQQKMGQWIYFRNTNPMTMQYDNFRMDLSQRLASTKVYYSENVEYSLSIVPTDNTGDYNNDYVYKILKSNVQFPLRYVPTSYDKLMYNIVNSVSSAEKSLSFDSVVTKMYQNETTANSQDSLYWWIYNDFVGKYDGITIQEWHEQWLKWENDPEAKVSSPAPVADIGLGKSQDVNINTGQQSESNYLYTGAFLFTNIENEALLWTETNNIDSYFEIAPGQSVTIPLKFQFFLNPSQDPSGLYQVMKSIYFDVRPSVLHQIQHYMIQVTAQYGDITGINKLSDNDDMYYGNEQ